MVVTVASYPIAILNAAMTATHYLRSAGQSSSIAKCFNLAFKHLGRLWVFTTIDAWITVNAILDRLPRKRGRRTAFDELLYYAWKIGTIGVVPALVAGKGYIDAAKDFGVASASEAGPHHRHQDGIQSDLLDYRHRYVCRRYRLYVGSPMGTPSASTTFTISIC